MTRRVTMAARETREVVRDGDGEGLSASASTSQNYPSAELGTSAAVKPLGNGLVYVTIVSHDLGGQRVPPHCISRDRGNCRRVGIVRILASAPVFAEQAAVCRWRSQSDRTRARWGRRGRPCNARGVASPPRR